MTYRCIDYIGDRAVVVATPSWLQRAFGARDIALDLVRHPGDAYSKPKWCYAGTGREAGGLVLDALDRREVGETRRATRGGEVAP